MRRQLSLYVPESERAALAAVRAVVDPVQSRLIPPHVTLCRDEELADLSPDMIGERLAGADSLVLAFGRAETFGGHGLLLPCVGGQSAFHRLRGRALETTVPRAREAHLTLAHPRNPRAAGNAIGAGAELPVPLVVRFSGVHWIEQDGADLPWRVRHTFGLGAGAVGGGRRCSS